MSDMKRQPKYVILVALDFENFEHYCLNPKIYYDTYKEAKAEMELKIKDKYFEEVQLKVEKLWFVLTPKKN